MKQLSNFDSMFVYQERNEAPMHISPILLYSSTAEDGSTVRFKDILQRFAERIHLSPVFRRKLVKVPMDLGNPYWVEDSNFDLEFHVRHVALPKPGDWRQFCIQIARIHSRNLDLSRPPWEAYVIEGLDNINGLEPGSFALYMKIHHSAIDGATGNQIVEALHDLSSEAAPVASTDTWRGEREPGAGKLLWSAWNRGLRSPSSVPALARMFVKQRERIKEGFMGKPFVSHEISFTTQFNENLSAHRVFGGLRMPLDDLKFIKNAVRDCTLNDVVLCIVGGALRSYLSAKKALPETSLVVAVPISTRVSGEENAQGGNDVSAMRMFLCTDLADPVERLRAINEDAIASKAYANAVGVERISTVVNSIPSGLASLGIRAATMAGLGSRTLIAHTCVTNVPGPAFPLYLCGTKATLWLGAGCPVDGLGLFHTVNSYHGYITITFICCRDLLPDPDFYHHCLNQAYNDLLEAARTLGEPINKQPAKPKASARKKSPAVKASRQRIDPAKTAIR
ncbi:MAG: WS/DGAT/MGAT family O-acyltransferase [Parahaliea sp.]